MCFVSPPKQIFNYPTKTTGNWQLSGAICCSRGVAVRLVVSPLSRFPAFPLSQLFSQLCHLHFGQAVNAPKSLSPLGHRLPLATQSRQNFIPIQKRPEPPRQDRGSPPPEHCILCEFFICASKVFSYICRVAELPSGCHRPAPPPPPTPGN